MLLVGVGAELCSSSWQARVSAIIEEANPSQVAVELTTGELHCSLFRVRWRLTTSMSSAAEDSTCRTKSLMIPVK